MVGVVCAGGTSRLGRDAGGSKGSIRGNEFGVSGGDHFVVGYERVHNRFLLVTVEARFSMLLPSIYMKVANWGGIVVYLAPAGRLVEW